MDEQDDVPEITGRTRPQGANKVARPQVALLDSVDESVGDQPDGIAPADRAFDQVQAHRHEA
jgi:hypothetical protein